jgi:ribosomal protein L4
MQATLLIAVEKIKTSIREHNQHSHTTRRNYSEDIKKSVIDLCTDFHLSSGNAGKLIGVSEVLISKWKKNGTSSKRDAFRKVSISQENKNKIVVRHLSGFYIETDFELLDLILLKIKSL